MPDSYDINRFYQSQEEKADAMRERGTRVTKSENIVIAGKQIYIIEYEGKDNRNIEIAFMKSGKKGSFWLVSYSRHEELRSIIMHMVESFQLIPE